MLKIRYQGLPCIRVVSNEDLQAQGIYDGDGFTIDATTPESSRARIVDVTDSVAELLTSREPNDWHLLNDEEVAHVDAFDKAQEEAKAKLQARIDADAAEIADNAARAEAAPEETLDLEIPDEEDDDENV